MRQDVLGTHPDTAVSLQQKALCLEDLGELERAESEMEGFLEVRVACMGPRDVAVASSKVGLWWRVNNTWGNGGNMFLLYHSRGSGG